MVWPSEYSQPRPGLGFHSSSTKFRFAHGTPSELSSRLSNTQSPQSGRFYSNTLAQLHNFLGDIPMRRLCNKLFSFLKKEDGPTSVEYAVMFSLIIVVCIS